MIRENWLAFGLVLLIGLLVAWWLFGRAGAGERTRHHAPDVLDEGAAPAARNQALIDAPSAASAAAPAPVIPPAVSGIMAGVGEMVAMGAQHEVEAAAAAQAATAAPVPAPATVAETAGDDLRKIKGVGPKLATLLGTLGVTSYAQIAAWDDAEIDRIDAQMGSFAGRIRRDNWVAQCQFLAAGDVAGFEGAFGKL